MSKLHALDVSLVFPITTRGATYQHLDSIEQDNRMIVSPKGKIMGIKALSNICLRLESGDRLALVGENGAGKTTLLQVLSGILSPDEGEVRVTGASTSIININLGMQFQATGHKNILLRGLAMRRYPEEIEEKRAKIAEFSGLGDFLNLPVSTYSAGMRMRLSFAIATAFEPEILILDEWLSAGDASFRSSASTRMKEFVGKAGILVFASHSRQLLKENCNIAAWLKNGKIQIIGDIDRVLLDYDKYTKR